LERERDSQTLAHNTWHRLLSGVNQFLFQLRLAPNQEIRPVSIASSLKANENPAVAIARVREEIAANVAEQARVRALPMRQESRQDAIVSHLAALARESRPRVSFDQHGRPRINWASADFISRDEILGLMALICPEAALALFDDVADAPADPSAVSPEERATKLNELAATLLLLERREAVLLANSECLPRPEMSAISYLQIRIAEREPEAQEAAVA
jgi:hypothetical protein